ncbi:MAG TPA: PDDEXK nuclease domain-containing protein [Clostridiales bacterium]|nr:PDDEXK nuclease domain-containing protein [Clostridiales bacterium]HQP70319.1 PDDEXK nuclease domain-containing protein [Clostridiales bacterium]
MKYEKLIELLETTHSDMQYQAFRSVDIALIIRNWLFGFYLVEYEQNGEDRAEYGKKLIDNISQELRNKGIKGVSATNLKKDREFYIEYKQIRQTVSVESLIQPQKKVTSGTNIQIRQSLTVELAKQFKLSWTHYVTLLTLDDLNERKFYEIESLNNSWSVRELERQISASLYQRLSASKDKEKIRQLSEKGQIIEKASDLIKNPYLLEFAGIEERYEYSENQLETALINKIEMFLLELGKGFLFESRQKRFTFDNDHYYVDLVFYNRLLKCYVLIDLKRDKLTHQDLGQMQMYVNYYDRYVKLEDENPTIGIILCHRKNDALVELTLPENKNIYASKYMLYLPTKEELKRELEKNMLMVKDEMAKYGVNK